MRKLISLFVSACFLILTANAQKVSGVIKDQQGKGLDKSTVSLLRAKDSSVIKLSVTTDAGHYSIIAPQPGSYLVSASHVGYVPLYSKALELSGSVDITLADLSMARLTAELKGVTVTATKQMVEVKADKTILNVEGTINSTGYDALELLRKSPGVLLDKDDNISLLGKNG